MELIQTLLLVLLCAVVLRLCEKLTCLEQKLLCEIQKCLKQKAPVIKTAPVKIETAPVNNPNTLSHYEIDEILYQLLGKNMLGVEQVEILRDRFKIKAVFDPLL